MYEAQLAAMLKAAKDAEVEIKKIYETSFAVEIKSDNSPVTAADKTADALIRKELSRAFPDYGLLTEESKDTKERLSKRDIWIVDPVDGTKEFVARNGEFTTNIALAHDLFPEVQDSVHLLQLQRHGRGRRCPHPRIRPFFPSLYGPQHQDPRVS